MDIETPTRLAEIRRLSYKPTISSPAQTAQPMPTRALLSVCAKAITAGKNGTRKNTRHWSAPSSAPTALLCGSAAKKTAGRPKRTGIYDWELQLVALHKELAEIAAL